MGSTFVVEFPPEVTSSYFVAFRGPRASQRRPKATPGAKNVPKLTPQAMTKITSSMQLPAARHGGGVAAGIWIYIYIHI